MYANGIHGLLWLIVWFWFFSRQFSFLKWWILSGIILYLMQLSNVLQFWIIVLKLKNKRSSRKNWRSFTMFTSDNELKAYLICRLTYHPWCIPMIRIHLISSLSMCHRKIKQLCVVKIFKFLISSFQQVPCLFLRGTASQTKIEYVHTKNYGVVIRLQKGHFWPH